MNQVLSEVNALLLKEISRISLEASELKKESYVAIKEHTILIDKLYRMLKISLSEYNFDELYKSLKTETPPTSYDDSPF